MLRDQVAPVPAVNTYITPAPYPVGVVCCQLEGIDAVKFEVGSRVRTPWGAGEVVGYNTMVKRYAVRIPGYSMPRLVPANQMAAL